MVTVTGKVISTENIHAARVTRIVLSYKADRSPVSKVPKLGKLVRRVKTVRYRQANMPAQERQLEDELGAKLSVLKYKHRADTDNSHHRYDVILLIIGGQVAQIELKTLGINSRRAVAQIVEYKNHPGNGYSKT